MLSAAMLALLGCSATFDDYPGDTRPSRAALAGANPSELSLAVRLSSSRDGVTWTSQDVSPAPRWISKILLESGGFSAIRTPEVDAPLHASLVIERFTGPLTGLLSIASGFVIPGVQDRGIRVTLDLRASDEPWIAVRRELRFRVWWQVFLIPLHFTRGPALSESRFAERMLRDCVYEALKKLAAETNRSS
ncbi:MAG: hypothetical protein ACE5IL_12430 [Myxococcota bacterium]